MKDIQPVIAMPETQVEPVMRMVEFCKALDGTELLPIPIDDTGFTTPFPHNRFPCLQASSLRAVSRYMKDSPFIWIEPDSVPLKVGWKRELSAEYFKAGKMFMVSSDSHPPHDMCCGIGIYPPETWWMIPQDLCHNGWDLWMIQHLKPLIHFTPLIQHSYGIYEGVNVKRNHRFPLDQGIIREDAVIFHRDRHADLMNKNQHNCERVFSHCGDIGDVIASLPAMRQLGGGKLVITHKLNGQRESMKGPRMESIARLLRAQPYITGLEYSDFPQGVTHDFCTFRLNYQRNKSLAHWQADHLGIGKLDLYPWIGATPHPRSKGRVAMARSPRYHNDLFPWKELREKHKDAFFIGLPNEHAEFERVTGKPIEFIQTSDLMEMAELLAGSKMLIANQSCPFWIATGLGIPTIQESWERELNSIIERPQARYFIDNKDLGKVME